jgi:D-alanyl-D-alanine carboxypeptidase
VDTTDFDVAELSETADLGVEATPIAVVAPVPAPLPAARPLVGDVIGAWLSGSTTQLGAPPAALGLTAPSAPLLPPVGVGEDGEPIDLLTSGSVPAVEVASIDATQTLPASLPRGGWIVQIGAAPTEAGANSLLSGATSKVGALSGFKSFVERFEKGGQTYFRARFGGFGGQQQANEMCKLLQKQKLSCLAMQG